MEVLEENSTNWLVLTPDGGTDTKTKSSKLNQLLFGHNLFGLIDRGDEIWTRSNTGEPDVQIIPDDNAECYTLKLGDAPGLTLGKHQKTHLIDALAEVYNEYDGESVQPLVDLYDNIRANMVREEVLDPFYDIFSDKVGRRDNGWFINGHLLLTYEVEFYHSEHTSRTRSGRIIGSGLAEKAYSVDFDDAEKEMQRELTIDGQTYRLTEDEIGFIARAMWAVGNTPDKRD